MTPKEKQFILERVENALAEIEKHSGRAERKIKRLLLEIRNECEHAKETALVREQVRETAGNAAKMREALEKVKKLLLDEAKWADEMTINKAIALGVIKDTLSAPARNCDLYLTPKDAMLAHLEEVYEGEKVEFGDYEWCEFFKWLFAEAKEFTNK